MKKGRELMAQNLFRRFKIGITNFKDKPRSRRTSVVEDEALLEFVEQQPRTRIRKLLAEAGPLKNTINRHFHKLSLVNRR